MRYRRAAILCSILCSVGIPAADAALPPYVYEQARDQATYHLQIKVTNVTPPAKTPGECETSGEVVRIFRDRSGTLRLGTRLAFAVSCSRRGDPPIVGGVLWTDYDALMRARYLEAFLNHENGRYRIALWQSRIIEAPTDKPVLGPTSATPPTDRGSRSAAGDPYEEVKHSPEFPRFRSLPPATNARTSRPAVMVRHGACVLPSHNHPHGGSPCGDGQSRCMQDHG